MVTSETSEDVGSEPAAKSRDGLPFARSGPGEAPTHTEQFIYRKCVIDGSPWDDVENIYGIDWAQIAQICSKVAEWRVSILPRSKLSLDDQQVMVDQVTIERLEYLYSQATEAWRESRKDQSLTKRAIIGAFDGTMAIRTGVGHAALLVAAAKIVMALGKYQTQCVERRAKALAQLERHGESPPVRACSTGASEQPVLEGNSASVDAANDCLVITSGESKAETVPMIPIEARSAQPVHSNSEGGGRGVPENGGSPGKPKPR